MDIIYEKATVKSSKKVNLPDNHVLLSFDLENVEREALMKHTSKLFNGHMTFDMRKDYKKASL